MGKLVPDTQLDAMLAVLFATADRVDVCADTPTTYGNATTAGTFSLGNVVVTAGVGNGDWTAGAGDVSGRKVTLGQQTGVSVTNSGTATHIAWTDGSATLFGVTTCTSQVVTSGNTMTINAFDVELQDAA